MRKGRSRREEIRRSKREKRREEKYGELRKGRGDIKEDREEGCREKGRRKS